MEWKRSWGKGNEPPRTTPKAGLHPEKVMLCIWWDWKGVLCYDLFLQNHTINSSNYCSQLNQLKAALNEKCPALVNRRLIIFHQDNTRPHVSFMTRQKLLQLGWEVLIHPPYSPDIAPSDFHLFWSLQNSLNGKNLISLENCKRHLEQFFAQKDKKFWEGLPWWCSGWESACLCGGHGFGPWSGEIPRAVERLGPCAAATEPALWSP